MIFFQKNVVSAIFGITRISPIPVLLPFLLNILHQGWNTVQPTPSLSRPTRTSVSSAVPALESIVPDYRASQTKPSVPIVPKSPRNLVQVVLVVHIVQPVQPIIKYWTASKQPLLLGPLPPRSNRTVNIILDLVNHRRAQLRRVLCIPKINIIPGTEFNELERWLNYQLPIQILLRPNFKNLSCLAKHPKLLPVQFWTINSK